jgi:type-F conjugative transfer system mating-pair stabilization protein traN
MKKRFFLIAILLFNSVAYASSMNDAFKQGQDVGKGNNGNAQQIMKDFQPTQIQDFTERPKESQFYTGVKGGNPNLMGKGMNALETTESGKAIKDSIINNPKVKISQESDFIQSSNNIRNNAEAISGIKGEQCVNQVLSKTLFSSHFCEKDNAVEQQCKKTANVKWTGEIKTEVKKFKFSSLDFHIVNDNHAQIIAPENGIITGFTAQSCDFSQYGFSWNRCQKKNLSFLGINIGDFRYGRRNFSVANLSVRVNKGQPLDIFRTNGDRWWHPWVHRDSRGNVRLDTMNITLDYVVEENTLKPETEWDSNCPTDTGNAIEMSAQCTQPAETRMFEREGKTFQIHQDCWEHSYNYLISESSDNECKKYEDNPNCTVGERECILQENGTCTRHRVKYQCQTTAKTNGYICGDKFFCSDGSCADVEGGVNSDFGHVVSQLATLAQAGKDVGLDPEHLKAFSGKPMFCRKSGFGFSDCCKDSGWGHKAGLAKCNSEENALGKAKEKKLVVYVGTFCSKKVAKVCVQRKAGYCVFDNKLARIIQYQGRSGQLGIGFGGASSPDCRGITVDELQKIDFNAMDYSDFYDELNERANLPDREQIMEHMKNSIVEQLQNQ